jgi:hypothetical protein
MVAMYLVLAELLPVTLLPSLQLKVLEEAGLVIRSRERQKRPCRLAPQVLNEIARWMNDYRALWELKFDRLEGYRHHELTCASSSSVD